MKGGSAKAMYATVRRYEGVIDTSEAESLVEEGFIPIISEVPGFVAYYWVDAGDGTTMSIASSRTSPERRSPTGGLLIGTGKI